MAGRASVSAVATSAPRTETTRRASRYTGAAADPDLGGGAGDLVCERILDRSATGGLLDRGGVESGDAVEPVLRVDVGAGRRSCLRAQLRVGEGLERRRQRLLLALVRRHL